MHDLSYDLPTAVASALVEIVGGAGNATNTEDVKSTLTGDESSLGEDIILSATGQNLHI